MKKYIQFIKEVYEELKKVTWPSTDLVKTATATVLIFTLIIAVYLWGLDLLFAKIITFILER
ncbi:preprotein translocase subunit SecE [Sulfurihydrogenibium subterraneum]|uniref:preprotein translocase subunit SecE n=1 Tax=Sulfurihydrogenibium subterraneum TaxID=171121 RepID=UPI00048C788D|nr:preprotein translocase subunit SecE [Sulfurihydrogenibium subterraneum]